MPGSPQSDDRALSERLRQAALEGTSSNSDFSSDSDNHINDRADTRTNLPSDLRASTLEERELEAALQLLVERAQYITGATGTALALPQGDEMVCRASAGACAPAVGARLQVQSGLTGESIARRQLLRCDNAEADPRVNLETCRALGIASIVVLPLLRRTGEVRGLFELFSDHPYAFEERDLVALERMAALTLTALDLAEQGHDAVVPSPPAAKKVAPAGPATSPAARTTYSPKETPAAQPPRPETHADRRVAGFPAGPLPVPPSESAPTMEISPPVKPVAATETTAPVNTPPVENATSISAPAFSASSMSVPDIQTTEPSLPEPAPVPEAMRRVQKCASCGFPVSEGRTLCLGCESLERMKIESDKKAHERAAREAREIEASGGNGDSREATEGRGNANPTETKKEDDSAVSLAVTQEEILPPFLMNPQLVEESWLARHVNLLAFLVLVAAVLVAAVVFFR